jgi:hypothetical protein
MTEVWLNKMIIIEEKTKGLSQLFKAKTSVVNPFVCPKCGYLELVAENPTLFKE